MNKLILKENIKYDLCELSAQYQREGYVVIPKVVANNHLIEAQKEIIRLVKEATAGQLKSAITWFDYPVLHNNINVAEIVNPIEERGESIKNVVSAINSIEYNKIFKSVLGSNLEEYEATVMRFHVTTGQFKYSQPWHRDTQCANLDYSTTTDPLEIKVNVYFFDEIGFKLIPKTNDFFSSTTANDNIIWSEKNRKKHTFFTISGEVTVKAEKGDMLFFHPDLFHRGYSSNFRCSLHILFERRDRMGPRLPEFDNYNGLSYTPRTSTPAEIQQRASTYQQIKNICFYFSPIPSWQFFLNILNGFKYRKILKNVLYHRPSIYQD